MSLDRKLNRNSKKNVYFDHPPRKQKFPIWAKICTSLENRS